MTAREAARDAPSDPTEWKGTARYEVIGCLGRGGMGVVYEAFDNERREQVAVKTLLNVSAAALYLFKQEFRTLADVQHRNLVHLYELVVPENGQAFFTMELVRGSDFRQHVHGPGARKPSNPPATVVVNIRDAADRDPHRPRMAPGAGEIEPPLKRSPADMDRLRPALRQLVEGVEALHAAGKMHRDIKPSNVLVTPEGRVVLLDFGVATELAPQTEETKGGSGELVGTARYMAPEQASDGLPTPASDWYSVGVVLYEALVGRPPFAGDMADVLTMKNSMDAPAPSACVDGVPADLDGLCRALLHREPSIRPTGAEILRRLGATDGAIPLPIPAPVTDAATAFIGREAQLKVLRLAFESTRGGRGVGVRVAGASGMGKSTLVHRFLDEVVRGGDTVVLRGRAYERESVPYKAVDSIIDTLSRQLLRLAEIGAPLPLPPNAWALGRLFPVLQRVPGFEPPLSAVHADEPHAVRREAFGALRALFDAFASRQGSLVLFIDDVHWGDVDSAELLLDLLRPPNAPPIMLLLAFREGEARASPFLLEMRSRWPVAAVSHDVVVGPLEPDDARRLATSLLDAGDDMTHRTARAVARESRGSPFLVEELVRSNRGIASATGATLAVLTLEQMVGERVDRLPQQARRLLEIVSVSGRPLPVSVVASASGVEGGVHEILALLSARRLVRTGLRDGREVVETTHDRIRETLLDSLSGPTLKDHHRHLARVLEEIPGGDAEAVALHWLGAGDIQRAARFAEDAAGEAAGKFAFEKAARLYELAIEGSSASETARLLPRLAEALRVAGRCDESAQAYLRAARSASGSQRLELQRAAAQQMVSAGRLDEGTEVLRTVLAAVGMRAPRSPLGALMLFFVYRVWLAVIGLGFKERDAKEVSAEDRLRIEALFTVSMGFSLVNVILAECMQVRHLIQALRKGDRLQVMRATSLSASHMAARGRRPSRLEEKLLEISRRLADRLGDPEATDQFAGLRAASLFERGRWKEARDLLEQPYKSSRYGNVSFLNVRLFAIYAGFTLGEIQGTVDRIRLLYADAEDRKDRYTLVNLNTGACIYTRLSADDPARARRHAEDALATWPRTPFSVQRWQAMVYAPDIDLYEGDAATAYERFTQAMPKLERSFLMRSGFIRAYTAFTRGRLAIASIEGHEDLLLARVREALRAARLLERETNEWTFALAFLVRACAENAAGNKSGAVLALRAALDVCERTQTWTYVGPARYRLGQLVGGAEGAALMKSAVARMEAQGVRNPERWTATHLPGKWESAASP